MLRHAAWGSVSAGRWGNGSGAHSCFGMVGHNWTKCERAFKMYCLVNKPKKTNISIDIKQCKSFERLEIETT